MSKYDNLGAFMIAVLDTVNTPHKLLDQIYADTRFFGTKPRD